MKTVFERYLEDSVRTFTRVYGKPMTTEILYEFFPKKIAYITQEINLDSNRKNAILLLGKSCCGKTTLAKEFCKKYPEFTHISMDECSIRDLETIPEEERFRYFINEDLRNSIGNHRFGNMIANGTNIIVDGGWGYMNARGAILKTLDYYGYYTIIVSMTLIPNNLLAKRREKRVLNGLAKELLNNSDVDYYDKDYVQIFADKNSMSYDNAVKELRKTPNYKLEMLRSNLSYQEDDAGACWEAQKQNGLFFYGADAIYFVESF